MSLTAKDQLLIELWAAQHNVVIEDSVHPKIETYHDLIVSWSRKMNLISRGDIPSIIENHFLDSLSPLDLIPHTCKVLDVGSGAGFPAIPLALFRPKCQFTLVESIHKKALFLRMAIDKLELKNVMIIEKRLEGMEPDPQYDIVTIRALPGWEKLLKKIRAFLNTDGVMVYYEKRGVWRKISKS